MIPTPEANLLGIIVVLGTIGGFALIAACIWENKKAQTFLRGVCMFLAMIVVELPLLLYLRQTGVEIPGTIHAIIWSFFAVLSTMATVTWR